MKLLFTAIAWEVFRASLHVVLGVVKNRLDTGVNIGKGYESRALRCCRQSII